jgi:Domain of unknown function (DUF4136)
VDFGLLGVRVALKKKETDLKSLRFIAVCAAVALVTSTAGFAQNVQTDFDHQANFAQYKTYSWQEIKPSVSLWDSRIKNAVNTQLEAKGLAQVADGGDIAIVAIKTSQTQRTLQTFYDGFGGGWRWRGFGDFGDSTTTEQDYQEGTLVIDLFDGKTKQLIWRGSTESVLSDKAEKNEKTLNKGVAKMFKNFPPESGKR